MAKLSVRQEYFVREYIKLGGYGKGAEAYRLLTEKYPRKQSGCKPISYRQCAYAMRKRPDVQRREHELRKQMAKRADFNVDRIIEMLMTAFKSAEIQGKANDMTNATMSIAKMCSLLPADRIETGKAGDFSDLDNVSDIVERLGELVGADAALLVCKALGLETPQGETEIKKGEPGLISQAPPSDSVN